VRNRGELSEGWYDPATLWKAQQSELDPDRVAASEPPKSAGRPAPTESAREEADGDSDSDDSVGPTLPGQEGRSRRARAGPSIPNLQDLELKRGMYKYSVSTYLYSALSKCRNGH
jgi:hypothetical protein